MHRPQVTRRLFNCLDLIKHIRHESAQVRANQHEMARVVLVSQSAFDRWQPSLQAQQKPGCSIKPVAPHSICCCHPPRRQPLLLDLDDQRHYITNCHRSVLAITGVERAEPHDLLHEDVDFDGRSAFRVTLLRLLDSLLD